MTKGPSCCLILACGNTLRGDDGVGPWLANWAEERFRTRDDVRVVSMHQWTPELAEDTARAESILFIDCSADTAPGLIRLVPVEPAASPEGLGTHHMGAAELLAMGKELYGTLPRCALMMTIGAGATELSEEFSDAVQAALPNACSLLEETILRLLADSVA